MRYGARDVLVPAAHGAWLGRNVPGATVVVEQDPGHMGDPDKVVELTRWLVSGRRQPTLTNSLVSLAAAPPVRESTSTVPLRSGERQATPRRRSAESAAAEPERTRSQPDRNSSATPCLDSPGMAGQRAWPVTDRSISDG